MKDIRYWRGKVKIELLEHHNKKAIIKSLEFGMIGNKREGFKMTFPGEHNITLIRHCWRKKSL